MNLRYSHDANLAAAFDHQAAMFEKAPVQSNTPDLERLVEFAKLPADSLVLDAGCGPGLVAQALLQGGHRVFGVDLSAEMIERARRRCQRFGERARFAQMSVYDPLPAGPFDAAMSRYVLHHVADASAFVVRQTDLLRPGGVLVLSDHTTDPDPARAAWHQEIEKLRDHTHMRNFSPGQIVDLLGAAGLGEIRSTEQAFELDFDEWFDRGSPAQDKQGVRDRLLVGHTARGFYPTRDDNGSIRIACWRAMVRGVKPKTE